MLNKKLWGHWSQFFLFNFSSIRFVEPWWSLVDGRKLMIGGKIWGATSRMDGVVIDGKTYGSTIVENKIWACGANWW